MAVDLQDEFMERMQGSRLPLGLGDFDLSGGLVGSGANGFVILARLLPSKAEVFPQLAGKQLAIKYLLNIDVDLRSTNSLLGKVANEIEHLTRMEPHENIQRLYGWFSTPQNISLIQQHFLRKFPKFGGEMSQNDLQNYNAKTLCVVSDFYEYVLCNGSPEGVGRSFVHQVTGAQDHLPTLIGDVRAAVRHLISQRVSHLDLKEDNIAVTMRGGAYRAVLIDFGLAVQHTDASMSRSWLTDQSGRAHPPEPVGNGSLLPPSLVEPFARSTPPAERFGRSYRDADMYSLALVQITVGQTIAEVARQRALTDSERKTVEMERLRTEVAVRDETIQQMAAQLRQLREQLAERDFSVGQNLRPLVAPHPLLRMDPPPGRSQFPTFERTSSPTPPASATACAEDRTALGRPSPDHAHPERGQPVNQQLNVVVNQSAAGGPKGTKIPKHLFDN